jgi:hypothetical protein
MVDLIFTLGVPGLRKNVVFNPVIFVFDVGNVNLGLLDVASDIAMLVVPLSRWQILKEQAL